MHKFFLIPFRHKVYYLEFYIYSCIIERTTMMIREMAKAGKTRDEIKSYLISSLGLNDRDADKLNFFV